MIRGSGPRVGINREVVHADAAAKRVGRIQRAIAIRPPLLRMPCHLQSGIMRAVSTEKKSNGPPKGSPLLSSPPKLLPQRQVQPVGFVTRASLSACGIG